jgi:pimeloyl-ACP methyl ester carboxylesterase
MTAGGMKPDDASERTVSSADGVELAVREAGDRGHPTVVLVHGYPNTKELWRPMLEHLTGRYHLVAYDVRGAGASTARRGPAAYDFERLGDDLEAVIAALAPGKRVHLVGHDWGGIQGWEFATHKRFDGVLASFTTIAGPSLDQVSIAARELMQRPTPRNLLELATRVRRSWYILGLWTPGGPTLAWRTPGSVRRWQWVLRRRERIPPDRARVAPTFVADATRAANLYRRNIPRRIRRPRTDAVAHVPVQLIVPSADHFISPRYYELADRYTPKLRRRTIASTHWAPLIQPKLLAGWIAEFVDEVEAAGLTTKKDSAFR